MPSLKQVGSGRTYWRSLEELADSPEFRQWVSGEFPGPLGELLGSASRRGFLKVMGASFALAGLTGCRWPKEKIVPYAHRPEERIPGVPEQYATAMELSGFGHGLLVTSYDGRPIKVEGNPSHPVSRGAADVYAQASILEMYDPDRSQQPVQRSRRGDATSQDWDGFLEFARKEFAALKAAGGEGLAILTEPSSSPALQDMWERVLRAYPQARWYEYDPLSQDSIREGLRLAFGHPSRPQYACDKAEVIVSLDSDFLMTHPAAVKHSREFARGRRGDNLRMNRLYVVESDYTVTGSMADHRMAVKPSEIPALAAALTAAVLASGPTASPGVPAAILAALEKAPRPGAAALEFASKIAADLLTARGRSMVIAGPSQPPIVHALAAVLNTVLGNVGAGVTYSPETGPDRPSHSQSIRALAGEMRAGRVSTLIILGGNPIYDAPADLDFGKLLGGIQSSIRLGLYEDETSAACTWHLPRAHELESWGDTISYDGTLTIQQPLIEPLYDGKTPAEVLSLLVDEPPLSAYHIVRRRHSALEQKAWKRALHDGVIEGAAGPSAATELQAASMAPVIQTIPQPGAGAFEVLFRQDYSVRDGRYANNGWLQELPDPMTKLTWDNAAVMSVSTASSLEVSTGDRVRVKAGQRTLEAPVYVMPGLAAGTVALALGYGRTAAGRVGNGVGVNAYSLRASDQLWWAAATVERIEGRYEFAVTQDHHVIDRVGFREREIRAKALVREASLEEYRRHPDFAKEAHAAAPLTQLFGDVPYSGHRWGMAIDLSACTGCSACVVACVAENNIPVVGKDQVRRGREMHWIRVDRYFTGEPDAPEVRHQPVTCQHCENAPCEQVCPVGATQHSSEGLNDMAYNRCIGTRYCSNNCPYKVRRFNWFNNHKDVSDLEQMMYNPEVTVRSRGVMEKCTFCIQRINAVKIAAKNDRRAITDGEIIPACAQTCPSQAIVFGDLNDPESRVRRLHEDHRAYAILEELNVRPRARYLAKLRNPA